MATSYNSIAISLKNLGREKEALEYKQKALAIQLKLYGEAHPDVAQSYTNIGYSLEGLGKKEEAQEYRNKAAQIRKKLES